MSKCLETLYLKVVVMVEILFLWFLFSYDENIYTITKTWKCKITILVDDSIEGNLWNNENVYVIAKTYNYEEMNDKPCGFSLHTTLI